MFAEKALVRFACYRSYWRSGLEVDVRALYEQVIIPVKIEEIPHQRFRELAQRVMLRLPADWHTGSPARLT